MLVLLHKQAAKTKKVQALIQASTEPAWVLAKRYSSIQRDMTMTGQGGLSLRLCALIPAAPTVKSRSGSWHPVRAAKNCQS